MKLSRRVKLGNAQLDEAAKPIVIRNVEIREASESFSTVMLEGVDGQRVTGHRRDSLDVSVRFAIDIGKRSLEERAEALEAAVAWAAKARKENGGAWMTVNWKPKKQLRVYLATPPAEGDLWDWTKDFEIVFRAFHVPYWQDEEDTVLSFPTGNGGSASIAVPGTATTKASVSMKNTTSTYTINAPSITVAGKTMAFEGLALGPGETLVIDHTAEDLLRIRIQNTGGSYRSVMSKRTAGSDHDFILEPGNRTVTFSTGGRNVKVTASVRGRYL